MSLTSDDVLAVFGEACSEYGKLFVPTDASKSVAENLVKYYSRFRSEQLLIDSIWEFVKGTQGAVTIFDFAVSANKWSDKVEEEKDAMDELNKLMRFTQERMNDLG